MKLYFKLNKSKEGNTCVFNIVDKGKVVYGASNYLGVSSEKYSPYLEAMIWVVKRLKTLVNNGTIQDCKTMTWFLDNMTVYTWLETKKYNSKFGTLMEEFDLEFEFLTFPVEFIYSKSSVKNIKNIDTDKAKKELESAKDFLSTL